MSPECHPHHITGTSEGCGEPQEKCPEGQQLRVMLPQHSKANPIPQEARAGKGFAGLAEQWRKR